MTRAWWRTFRWTARAAMAVAYRRFRVAGVEDVPATGPALIVVNHPSSLLDAAAVLAAVPRPVTFAARSGLFAMPVLGWILRRLGGVALHRPEDAEGAPALRRNIEALAVLAARLREGDAVVVFPEGFSHVEPRLLPVRSGPARIALDAEEASGWTLGVAVVPIGLQFEPHQRFRCEAAVRVGKPFGVADLKDAPHRAAIRTVQGRIAAALRPLVLHLDRVDLEPLVRRVADLYEEHHRSAPDDHRPLPRPEVLRIAGACLNHYLVADPSAVERVQTDLARYERLAGHLRVSPEGVGRATRPFRAFLGWLGVVLEIALGLPVFAAGMLVGYVPWRATSVVAQRLVRRAGEAALPHTRILVGLVVFGVPWAVLTWLVHGWSGKPEVTAAFAAALVATSLYAHRYVSRFPAWTERLASFGAVAFRRRSVLRAARLRGEFVAFVAELARRYESETGTSLVPPRGVRLRKRFPFRRAGAALFVLSAAWFAWGLRDAGADANLGGPSPWARAAGDAAARRTAADASTVLNLCDTLDRLAARMRALRDDFASGRRSHYSPADDAAVAQAMLTYVTCRKGLLRIAWFYREPDAGPAERAPEASLLGYVAAVELVARGMQFVDAFQDDPDARRKIEEGDPAWGVPPGMLARVRSNLADGRVLDAVAAGTAHFDTLRAAGRLPAGDPWDALAARAAGGAQTVAALADRVAGYKWAHALDRAKSTLDTGRYEVSSAVSTWIGDARLRERGPTDGLIRPDQLAAFRAKLRPGDILLERRNWFLSNAFLPGFWPHSALYVGGEEGLRELGLADDPDLADAVAAFRTKDAEGNLPAIVEAISEGVVATALEESIGGADSAAAFRPRLPREEVAAAVARALRNLGKPYDFDFDFFSADKLVCTEVVYHSYEGPLHFELVDVMGRRTLPALEFVRKWDHERGTPAAQMDFVAFLDGDEGAGAAAERDETALRATLDRPGITFLQANAGPSRFPGPVVTTLAALLGLGLVFLRKP